MSLSFAGMLVGLPLLIVSLLGARGLGAVHRRLANRLLRLQERGGRSPGHGGSRCPMNAGATDLTSTRPSLLRGGTLGVWLLLCWLLAQ